jgi:hypothetical protein
MQWRAFILKTGPPKQFFEKVNAGAVVHLVGIFSLCFVPDS